MGLQAANGRPRVSTSLKTSFINDNYRNYHSEVAKLNNQWMILRKPLITAPAVVTSLFDHMYMYFTLSPQIIDPSWKGRDRLPGVPTLVSLSALFLFGSMAHSSRRQTPFPRKSQRAHIALPLCHGFDM